MATVSTTLSGGVTQGQNTVTLAAFTNPATIGISPKVWLIVDGEKMLVTNTSLAPTLQVTRGHDSTAASAHAAGAPVAYGLAGDFVVTNLVPAVTSYSVNGAITIPTTPPTVQTDITIMKAGVCALTLGAPAADQNGLTLQVTSNTAFAHTVTATGLLQTGTASVNVATFGAYAGASVTLQAMNGKWSAVASNGITFS